MELIEEITNATDNQKHAIGAFIDLKKTFDTVDHGILIKKLKHGVRGVASDCMDNKLSLEQEAICQYSWVFFGFTRCHLWSSAGVYFRPNAVYSLYQ